MTASNRAGLTVSLILLLALFSVGREGSCTDPLETWENWQYWEFELERLGHSVETDSLKELVVESDDLLARSLAARILGARGESSAIPTLRKVARSDSNASVRQDGAWALAALGDPEGLELLKQQLLEGDGLEEKLSAAFALADFEDYEGYEVVLTAAASDLYWNRMNVAAGIYRFLKADAFSTKQRPSRLLLRLAEDPDERVRRQALVQFSQAAAITDRGAEFREVAARLASGDTSPEVRESARQVVSALDTWLQESHRN